MDYPMDYPKFIGETERGLGPNLNAYALHILRSAFDDPAFLEHWLEFLRTTNDRRLKEECIAGLTRIMRRCGDLSAQRANQLTNTKYGMGIGTAALTASLVGIATAASAGLFIAPFLAGAAIAGGCMSVTSQISREEKLYKDIEARIAKILEKSDGR